MTTADVEREAFGEPLTITERTVGGVTALVGAAGHAALAVAAVLYVLGVLGAV